jgi:hypothetical protein
MPSPLPLREWDIYFVGAGLSCALGLPNTAMLLDEVRDLADRSPRWKRLGLRDDLERAFQFFYPDAVHEGYMPDVVDFFSALRTYLDVGAGLPGGFADAPLLYRSLRLAIAQVLIERTREAKPFIRDSHPDLDQIVQPGHIVITSNWDVLIERYAQEHGVPLRLSGTGDPEELVLLKLHGSVDWCIGGHISKAATVNNYATLSERLFASRSYQPSIPAKTHRANMALRTRAIERWGSAWRTISSFSSEPYMVTMARGKTGDLGSLRGVWRDAYGALSRARNLEIIGYSMPPDDIEIRTLLRAGVQRGEDLDGVIVRNPAPEVHLRVRQYLDRTVESDYRGVALPQAI